IPLSPHLRIYLNFIEKNTKHSKKVNKQTEDHLYTALKIQFFQKNGGHLG
ncbi:unnamed protein product, partial [Callosobruchus maculatus]